MTLRFIATIFSIFILACTPKYEREPCGQVNAVRCSPQDQPQTCDGATPPGWTTHGDEPCSRSGQHCVVEGNTAFCAPGLVDGGVQ